MELSGCIFGAGCAPRGAGVLDWCRDGSWEFPLVLPSVAGAASSPLQGYLFLEAFCAHARAQISARDQSLASQQELSTLLAHAINLQVLSMVLS